MKRSFLFLQGPDSPFFAKLGGELIECGHRVLRINFSDKDKFFWDGENVADYKYPLADFAAYINNVARLRKITDLVIYGDSTSLNKVALNALKNQKIRIYVFDDGYFGKNWITCEDRIFGDKTILPKDPRFYLRNIESELPDMKKFARDSRSATLFALQYRFSRMIGRRAIFPADREQVRGKATKVKRNKTQAKFPKGKYFLADFAMNRKASLIRSFSTSAPENDLLVFFSHHAISNFHKAKINELAVKYKVEGRVVITEEGNFKLLAKNSKAYITNCSLDALIVLKRTVPVLALSNAIYNMKGLTSQLPLAEFWNNPQKPDMEVFRKFRNYAITKTQINGSFYDRRGMELAVKTAMGKILGRDISVSEAEAFDAS